MRVPKYWNEKYVHRCYICIDFQTNIKKSPNNNKNPLERKVKKKSFGTVGKLIISFFYLAVSFAQNTNAHSDNVFFFFLKKYYFKQMVNSFDL